MYSNQQRSSSSSSTSTTQKVALAVGGSIALLAIGYGVKTLFFSSSSSSAPTTKNNNSTTTAATTTSTTKQKEQISPVAAPSTTATTTSTSPTATKISTAEQEKLVIARKTAGNTFFTQGRLDQAIECYQSCIDLADAAGTSEARKQGGVAMSNAMQCLLKQKRFQEVENSATFFLETVWSEFADDMLTSKVLYRRAQARVSLNHEKEAIEDLKQASSKTEGKFVEVEQLLKKLEEKQEKEQQEKSAEKK